MTIYIGEYFSEMTLLAGIAFKHITIWNIKWMINFLWKYMDGNSEMVLHVCSLMVLMPLSIYPMSDWEAVVLTYMRLTPYATFSNYISIKMTWTIKPPQAYNLLTLIKELLCYLAVQEGKWSDIPRQVNQKCYAVQKHHIQS